MNGQWYLQTLSARLALLEEEADRIAAAADILSEAQKNDRLIHVFGTEPALAALVTEVFFRPGAPLHINPILDPALDPAHGAYRSAMCLSLDGLAPCILDYYEYVEPGDPILLLGSDPALPLFAGALQWAQAHGLQTIAVLCGNERTPACGADVTLCSHASFAAVPPEHTILTAALLNLLVLETLSRMPDPQACVWTGNHFVDLEKSRDAIDRLLFRIRHL